MFKLDGRDRGQRSGAVINVLVCVVLAVCGALAGGCAAIETRPAAVIVDDSYQTSIEWVVRSSPDVMEIRNLPSGEYRIEVGSTEYRPTLDQLSIVVLDIVSGERLFDSQRIQKSGVVVMIPGEAFVFYWDLDHSRDVQLVFKLIERGDGVLDTKTGLRMVLKKFNWRARLSL